MTRDERRAPAFSKPLTYLSIYARMVLFVVLRRPYKLTLLASGGCNLRCQVCSIWRNANTTLSLEEVQRIWHAFPLKPCWINLSGGEPTLNRELESILGFFVGLGRPLLITLTSNGYADCSELIRRVLEKNRKSIVYVSLSVDGDAPEHDAARGRSRSHARVLACYRRLLELRTDFPALKVGISTTLSRVNSRRILPFIRRMLEDNAALTINLSQVSEYYSNEPGDSFRELPAEELATLLRAVQVLLPKLSLDSFLKINFLEGAIRHLRGSYSPIPCASITSNVLVTSELDLVNCTLRYEAWTDQRASREAKLRTIAGVLRRPRHRLGVLRERVRESGCEQRCHTPCETYVHTISAVMNPRYAPRLALTYLRVCAESLFAA